MEMNNQLYTKRRITSMLGLMFSMAAMAVGLAVLLWILYVLFANGLSALDSNLLPATRPHPAPKGAACATPSWAA